MREISNWGREFQVWQYSVSHSILLLRSFHPQNYSTRIDIAFPGVELMHVNSSYDSLRLSELTASEASEFMLSRGIEQLRGTLFLLNEGEGYVQASSCHWHEDNGDHHTASKFGPLRGTP
jgi:hypothetical protein